MKDDAIQKAAPAAGVDPTPPAKAEMGWSSQERAKVGALVAEINVFLRKDKVRRALALLNKGQIIFDVRDGHVVQITVPSQMRKGKELP